MSELSKTEDDILNRLRIYIQEKGVSNEFLVQLIELSGYFLNLKTISNYAKDNNLSYNGVKNHRKIREIFGVKFVIDNE